MDRVASCVSIILAMVAQLRWPTTPEAEITLVSDGSTSVVML
jgi:hypothetical protein